MAHLITLTDTETKQEMLFNLDMVVTVSCEQGQAVITTRWGRTLVSESLATIEQKAKENGLQSEFKGDQ